MVIQRAGTKPRQPTDLSTARHIKHRVRFRSARRKLPGALVEVCVPVVPAAQERERHREKS